MFKAIRQRMLEFLLGLACLAILGTTALSGQGTTGAITGVVADPTGAVISGATVAILNQRSGVDFHLETNNASVYYIKSLIPGTDTVEGRRQGIQQARQPEPGINNRTNTARRRSPRTRHGDSNGRGRSDRTRGEYRARPLAGLRHCEPDSEHASQWTRHMFSDAAHSGGRGLCRNRFAV